MCQEQLGKLKTLLTPAEKANVQILAVSLDTTADSRVMAEEISKYPGELDFPLLSDAGHRVAAAYGIVNPNEVKPGIPFPAVFIINQEGVVAHRFLDEHGPRPSNEQLREPLKALGAVSN
jgi:peroxiredoxin